MKVAVEIENPAEWMENMAIAAFDVANPSAILKRLARAFATKGQPTIAATLDTMALLMREAELDGKTIALPDCAWRACEFLDGGK